MTSKPSYIFLTLATYLGWASAVLEPCSQPDVAKLPFCNLGLPTVDRAKDLVSRLTVDEKINQLMATAPAIDRFHIQSYNWWSESLHGILAYCSKVSKRCATTYPAPIGIGASFNMTLVQEMASQISSEGRRYFIEHALDEPVDNHKTGLDFWGPNINIFRDPRWGRGMETPGEDPYLTGQYAIAYVKGMQEGQDPRYLKTIATLKHFAGYSLENWGHYNRLGFDANITDQDLVQTYLPAFEAAIKQGKAGSVMCSYNAVNGVPTCASTFLLQEILRVQWGWDGYVVSDCGAVGGVYIPHRYKPTAETAARAALKAGVDNNCGTFYNHLTQALKMNLTTEKDMDKSLVRLFTARIRVGLFDPWNQQPYMQYPQETIGNPDHVETALQAARESIVLLKNDAGVLPLNKVAIQKVAVLGPHFNATNALCGGYHGTLPAIDNPLQAINAALDSANVTGIMGCDLESNSTAGFQAASAAAADADVAILIVGISTIIEAEGRDRNEIGLPGVQEAFIEEIAKVQKNIILVLVNGGPVDISAAKANPNVVAIVEAFYPGMKGAQAMAEVLFGAYNPSGRLPYTIHNKDFVDQISMADMSMTNFPGRTYRYFQGEVVYPFGYGLSYTSFSYSLEAISGESTNRSQYRVNVTNTGTLEGATSVLVFMSFGSRDKTFLCPRLQLVGFQKVSLMPGETKGLFFYLSPSSMKCYNRLGKALGTPNGRYSLQLQADAGIRLDFQHHGGSETSVA